ncbi:MAG: ammonium transporter [Fimbriimonadaceae bacterium]|jgi:Amt family ammonium transporter|nr:ammonium transporter [Fimbriimonadaceae bacterium]
MSKVLHRIVTLIAFLSLSALAFSQTESPAPAISPADSVWMIVATALVLIMTPALALFYGGLVHRKNVLNTMLLSFAMMGVVSLVWVLVGFSIAFGPSSNGLWGNLQYAFGEGLSVTQPFATLTIPVALFMLFQMKFAIITPALISGAVVERAKFGAFLLFTAIWTILVYSVVSCWVWNSDGWLFKLGALDFAGGTVVHVASGFAALGICVALGTRKHPGAQPHNTTLTLLGAGLLWFGWFGFNAGSAYAINDIAINAFLVTHIAAAAGMCAWMAVEYLVEKKVSAVGAASGLVAGLVGITPAAGFVNVIGGLVIGLSAGAVCFYGIRLKHKLGYDDALDVVGLHGMGGIIGSILTGVFASASVNPLVTESLVHGRIALVGKQALGVGAVAVFSLVVSWLLAKAIDKVIGLRVNEADEEVGLDVVTHGEAGYALVGDELGQPALEREKTPVG